ncbi:MAG: hypothetical protein Q7T51_03785 [Candidatus Moranbacteria bacterium]|nr:hypothetical protein [Candidatus Moranbacteria bacterium]
MSKRVISVTVILVIIIVSAIAYSIFLFSKKDFLGWRLNLGVTKIETSEYKGLAPNINFKYSKIFEIDSDVDKKYGVGYVVGLKLKTDNRTGCDIRIGGPELDFSKDSQSLADSIVGPIKEKAKNFDLIEKTKTKIGGQDALEISFSFLDPIGARIRLDQIFVKDGDNNFIIICGTGEYPYEFFKKDFRSFYNSIDFNSKIN